MKEGQWNSQKPQGRFLKLSLRVLVRLFRALVSSLAFFKTIRMENMQAPRDMCVLESRDRQWCHGIQYHSLQSRLQFTKLSYVNVIDAKTQFFLSEPKKEKGPKLEYCWTTLWSLFKIILATSGETWFSACNMNLTKNGQFYLVSTVFGWGNTFRLFPMLI